MFLVSMLAESIAGRAAFNVELLGRREDPMTWTRYLSSSDFWNRNLQELAIGVSGGGVHGGVIDLPASAGRT